MWLKSERFIQILLSLSGHHFFSENSEKPKAYPSILFDRSFRMSTFGNFSLHQEYASIAARGDPLNDIESLIEWAQFRPRLSPLYQSDTGQGGCSHTDVFVVLMKMLVLHCSSGMVSPTTSSNGRPGT